MKSLTILLFFISTFLFYEACTNKNHEPNNEKKPENLYWPGNFEKALYGGCFSRAKNVKIADSIETQWKGNRVWELEPGHYCHLELLTTGKGKYKIQFMGKASTEVKIVIKPVIKDSLGKSQTIDIPVMLKGDGDWHHYEEMFSVTNPYPGPEKGEVLITCYNGTKEAGFIDNLELIQIEQFNPEQKAACKNTIDIIKKDQALRMGFDSTGLPDEFSQVINTQNMAGKKIRLTFFAGFENISPLSYPWAGIVVSLRNGDNLSAKLIPSDPKPNWYVAALASPPGTIAEISATYDIPVDAHEVFLEVKAQKKMKPNICRVEKLYICIIE
jgi:hypothetical protein